MSEPVRVVLFDLDGTLVNSGEAILKAINMMLAEHGFEPLTEVQRKSFVGKRLSESLIPWRKDTSGMVKDFRRIYLETYMESTYVFPGVPELLKGLEREGIPAGIITLKTTVEAERVLREMDLLGFFEGRIFGDNSIDGPSPYRIKPDPEHALWALRGMGLMDDNDFCVLAKEAAGGEASLRQQLSDIIGGRACLVGDAAQDMTAGASAGLVPYGVLWGGRDPELLREGGAEMLFSEPGTLLEVLLGMPDTIPR